MRFSDWLAIAAVVFLVQFCVRFEIAVYLASPGETVFVTWLPGMPR